MGGGWRRDRARRPPRGRGDAPPGGGGGVGDERIDYFLEASRWQGEVGNREPAKCDELVWVAPERLPANVIPYVRRALENWRRGVWFDSFGWG